MNHLLTNAKAQELQEAFRLYDVQANGYVNQQELEGLLRLVGQNYTQEEIDRQIDL